jgi:hypothetical protein
MQQNATIQYYEVYLSISHDRTFLHVFPIMTRYRRYVIYAIKQT